LQFLPGFLQGQHTAETYTLYYRALSKKLKTHWKFAIQGFPATSVEYSFVQGPLHFPAGEEGHAQWLHESAKLVADRSVAELASSGFHVKTEKNPMTAYQVKQLVLAVVGSCEWKPVDQCSPGLQAALRARGWDATLFPTNVRGLR